MCDHIPLESLTLRSLFTAYKQQMLTTYTLINIENGLRLAQPFVLGLAINGLLRASYTGLLWFIAQHLLHMLISSLRRMYDTRAFTSVYSHLAADVIVTQRAQRVDVSKVAARSVLSRAYVDFFEQHVPLLFRALYSVAGALAMLAFYDSRLIGFCVLLIIPATLLNAAYGRTTFELSRRLHDRLENEIDVIRQGDYREIREHYDAVARWRIKLSDAEAINFSLMELFVLAVLATSLVHYCATANPEAGDIFAVFRYVLLFIMGVDSVPKLVQQMSRLRDIGFRVRTGSRPGTPA